MHQKMGRIYVLEECGSTNIEAKDPKYGHGDVVMAVRQTVGRGQRGRKWESAPGENLTFTVVTEPSFLNAASQFCLSQIYAISVVRTLERYGVPAGIKWTNDVYTGDLKICGMLLENDLKGERIARSIAGIGINVNQTSFPPELPNPGSIKSVTGSHHDTREVLEVFYGFFTEMYALLESGAAEEVNAVYNSNLYRCGQEHGFFIPGEGNVRGIIRGVEPSGRLMVEIEGLLRGFLFKEIEFLI